MPRFSYRVIDSAGNPQTGESTVDDQETLVRELQRRGYTVVEVQVQKEARTAPRRVDKSVLIDLGIRARDIALLTRYLATTLAAGMTIIQVLAILRQRASSPSMGRLLDDLAQDLQAGERFSDALAAHPRQFPAMYVDMVRVGETSGTLAESMGRLAGLLERQAAMRRKITAALAYPLFILAFTVCLTYGMVAFLMPLFTPVFEDSGLDLRQDYPLTFLLIRLSDLATSGPALAATFLLFVLAVAAFQAALRTEPGRRVLERIRYHTPFVGAVTRTAGVAALSRSLSVLLRTGVPLLQSLSLTAAACGNVVMEKAVHGMTRDIQEGRKLSEALDGQKIFPDLLVQMAQVGEVSGTLPEMMERAADHYEADLDAAVDALTALLEPLMMVVIGAVVGVFVMGVLLPILGVSTGVEGQL